MPWSYRPAKRLHVAEDRFRLNRNLYIAKSAAPLVVTGKMKVLLRLGFDHLEQGDKPLDFVGPNGEFDTKPAVLPINELRMHGCLYL